MNTNDLKPVLCPKCGAFCEGATHIEDQPVRPAPGDFSLCIECGTMLRFTEDMGLRITTDDDVDGLTDEKKEYLYRVLWAWGEMAKNRQPREKPQAN